MATTYTDASGAPIDGAFLAEIESYLSGYGLKVTKARATRGTSTEAAAGRADGATPTKAPRGHAGCAAHWKVPGMRRPLCIVTEGTTIREDGRDTGELVPAAWTDADTALAFAVDVATRATEHRTRASIGYHGADQSGAVLPEHHRRGTFDPAAGLRHERHALPKEWHPYGLRIGCDKCATLKAEQDAADARKAEQERMRATPHEWPSEQAPYMGTCELCGSGRDHEAHTWPAHTFVNKYGRCVTCERSEDAHKQAAA